MECSTKLDTPCQGHSLHQRRCPHSCFVPSGGPYFLARLRARTRGKPVCKSGCCRTVAAALFCSQRPAVLFLDQACILHTTHGAACQWFHLAGWHDAQHSALQGARCYRGPPFRAAHLQRPRAMAPAPYPPQVSRNPSQLACQPMQHAWHAKMPS